MYRLGILKLLNNFVKIFDVLLILRLEFLKEVFFKLKISYEIGS